MLYMHLIRLNSPTKDQVRIFAIYAHGFEIINQTILRSAGDERPLRPLPAAAQSR